MTDDSKKQLVDGLNEDLKGEFQAIIMYRLYASMVQGPYRQELRAFFANEIPEELRHAQVLADKIAALGGTPAAAAAPVTVVVEPKAMLEAALKAELETIDRYVSRRKQPRQAASTASPPNSTRSSPTKRTTATSCGRCSRGGRSHPYRGSSMRLMRIPNEGDVLESTR